MPDFGILKRVDLREVWSKGGQRVHSMARGETCLHSARPLGMELELQSREAACGDFSCDLLARDLGSNRLVVIENQLSSDGP